MSRSAIVLAVTAGLMLPTLPGEAHLMTTGLGPIYDGISHVFLSPEDLVPVMALALLGGQSGPATGRRVLFALPAAWLAGGLVGLAVDEGFVRHLDEMDAAEHLDEADAVEPSIQALALGNGFVRAAGEICSLAHFWAAGANRLSPFGG